MAQRVYLIPEKSVIALVITTPNVSTEGKTIYAYAVNSAGTSYQLDTASGQVADTSISMSLDFSAVPVGRYVLEVVADPSGEPVTLVPNSALPEKTILDVFDVTNIT